MLDEIIAEIRYWHRRRWYWLPLRMAADQQLADFLKLELGWRKSLPKDERDAIAAAVDEMLAIGEAEYTVQRLSGRDDLTAAEKGIRTKAIKKAAADPDRYPEFRPIIVPSLASREVPKAHEREAEAHLERLARTLPVWTAWAADIRGFGALSLATIVAEAGDLAEYPKKGHLWKRMGTAVIDGIRQGGLRKGAPKADWIAHGYDRARRARLFVIGDSLVKQGDHYRTIYLARKDYERRRAEAAGLTIAPSAKIPTKRAAEFMSDGHVHKRAQRYMEKRLLRDLWQAWRRAEGALPEQATDRLPAADEHRDERKANDGVPEMADVLLPTAYHPGT